MVGLCNLVCGFKKTPQTVVFALKTKVFFFHVAMGLQCVDALTGFYSVLIFLVLFSMIDSYFVCQNMAWVWHCVHFAQAWPWDDEWMINHVDTIIFFPIFFLKSTFYVKWSQIVNKAVVWIYCRLHFYLYFFFCPLAMVIWEIPENYTSDFSVKTELDYVWIHFSPKNAAEDVLWVSV